jgi:hypothetical protein
MLERALAAVVVVTLVISLAPGFAEGQTVSGSGWTMPRLPDGSPDLQGVWLSDSATPLERPPALAGRARLTDEEVAVLQARADRIFKDGRSAYAAGDAAFSAAFNDVETHGSVGRRPAVLWAWLTACSTTIPRWSWTRPTGASRE